MALTKIKAGSLEGYITIVLSLLCILLMVLVGYIGWQHLTPVWLILLSICALSSCIWLVMHIRQTVVSSYSRATLQLDAIMQEDYNQIAKAPFKKGVVFDFHLQLRQLSELLLQQKSHYDQQAFLLYQLIAQLDTPVLVFNAKHILTYGNDAFSQLYQQPWQLSRHASSALLGLERSETGWQFSDSQKRSQWQIKHSEFIDDGEVHHLLVFINLAPVLRESQLDAWQQLIRVLGHEIRNSLTPVSSMAETLARRATGERDKMALDVIAERCHHLQSFVERYASVSQPLQIKKVWFDIEKLTANLSGLFTPLTVTQHIHCQQIWGDQSLIEQVCINLFKNAREAGATALTLTVKKQDKGLILQLKDNGQGFANLDNLFVPLYTTKPDGNGIGLSLCRNIIEQHDGSIQLTNNQGESGVTVTLILPQADHHTN